MADKKNYDLLIIGSGPGGYVAAVRAAQLGMTVACVEKDKRLGGVCLNVGCIPSKALLDSSEYFHLAREELAGHGVKTGRVSLDLAVLMARKDKVVADLTDNVRKLLEGHKIDIIHGKAALAGNGRVTVTPPSGRGRKKTIQAKSILLATGSVPVQVPGLPFDGTHIVSSTEALAFDKVPKRLGVVGGGYIGLELGSVWNRLGSDVTVIEMLPKIAGTLDGQVGRTLDRLLKKQGMTFKMNTRVADARIKRGKVSVALETGTGQETATFDKLLVSVGRKPQTETLGLAAAGVETDPATGQIPVDAGFQTNVPGVYAIGDLIAGPMLAHKASAEGIAAVESMAGKFSEVNYDAIPAVVYTWPEVASVGLTEEEARQRKIPYCTGSYPFSGAGRARCMGETDGFVKIISHKKTDRVLGVHIIGPRAADMIAEAVLALEFGASTEDIARTIHGHPTFSEALWEAARVANECAIYAS
jgi:dihydrolipoyl dehydrogenase